MLNFGSMEQNQKGEIIFSKTNAFHPYCSLTQYPLCPYLHPRARQLEERVKGKTFILLEPLQVLTASVIICCVTADAFGINMQR